jgi:hypothetical protein
MQPLERARRPPVPLPEQAHQRRHEQGADDRSIDQNRRGLREPDLLHEEDRAAREREEHDGQHHGRGGDDATGPLDPERDRRLVVLAGVVVLLDPREHEHRVVRRQTESRGAHDDQ